MKLTVCTVALCATGLSGCASFRPIDVVNPSEVTLENAMGEFGRGLRAMLKERGEQPFGLIPASAEIQFRIAADAKDKTKLVLDMSRSATSANTSKDTKLGSELSQESSGTRDNTIAVKFVNLLTIPQHTLAYEKPDKALELLNNVTCPVVILSQPKPPSVAK